MDLNSISMVVEPILYFINSMTFLMLLIAVANDHKYLILKPGFLILLGTQIVVNALWGLDYLIELSDALYLIGALLDVANPVLIAILLINALNLKKVP